MNITQESTGELTAVVKISITEEDYREKVNNAIKDTQKKTSMKGFRPGKVPISLIQKMYGKGILAEEVEKILRESLTKYLLDNKINILGQPLPNREKNESVDFENQKEFDFSFDIGFAPEITIDLSEKTEMENYDIDIDDEMLDKEINYMRKQFGKDIKGETAENNNDMVHGEFVELDENGNIKENGIKHHSNVSLEYIKNETIKNKLIGAKPGDRVVIKCEEMLKDEFEAAYYTGVKKDEVKNIKSDFQFIVEEIKRIELAQINEEFYKKAFPSVSIATEEEFKEKVREGVKASLKKQSDKKLNEEIREKIVENNNFNLPEEFLKRWLKETNEKVTDEEIEKSFPHALEDIKWEIIESKIAKDNNLEVATSDIKDFAKEHAKKYWMSYGLSQEHITEEHLEKFADDMLKKEDTVKNIYDNLYNAKVMDFIKSKVKLNNKPIKFDEFLKLETTHHH